MRDIFVTLVVFGTLPFILKRPHIGILLWGWLGYMNPHKLSWGFAHDFPFAQITAIFILIGLFLSKESKKITWTIELRILALFIIWMFITTVFAGDQKWAWIQWDKVWKIQLMTFVTIIIMQDKWRVQAMIWVIAVSLGFYGFKGGIFTIMTGGSYAVYGPSGTFIYGNNEIGLALIMTIPLIRYLQLSVENGFLRLGLTITMWLSFVAVIGTQSRGALLGVVAMGLVLILKSRKKFLMIMLMIIIVPVLLSFMPDTWHDRMATIETYEQDGSAMGRINAWWMAYNLAKDNMLGKGYAAFNGVNFVLYAPNPRNHHDAHSIYFEVLGEHGFIGLGLFLLLGIATLNSARRIIKETKKDKETVWIADLAAMLQVSLIGYAVSGAFLGLAYFDLYYHLIALIALCKAILIKHQQKNLQPLPLKKMNWNEKNLANKKYAFKSMP